MPDKPWYDPRRPLGAKIYKDYVENKPDEPWYDSTKPVGSKFYIDPQPKYRTDYKTGKIVERQKKTTQMEDTDDAFTLSSGTIQEKYYAEYANYLKNLANKARISYATTKDLERKPEAAQKYKAEVDSIKAKLAKAYQNKPRERKAQDIVQIKMKNLRELYPDMEKKK